MSNHHYCAAVRRPLFAFFVPACTRAQSVPTDTQPLRELSSNGLKVASQ